MLCKIAECDSSYVLFDTFALSSIEMHVNISIESLLSDNNWPSFAGRVCNSDKQSDKQILCHFQRKGNLLLEIVIALRNPRILLEMYLSLTHQLISRWPIAWALLSPKCRDSLFSTKGRFFPQDLTARTGA